MDDNNKNYVPYMHYIVKKISSVSFPATKEAILHCAGEWKVPIRPGNSIKFSKLLSLLGPDSFECATAFYCAVAAAAEKYGL